MTSQQPPEGLSAENPPGLKRNLVLAYMGLRLSETHAIRAEFGLPKPPHGSDFDRRTADLIAARDMGLLDKLADKLNVARSTSPAPDPKALKILVDQDWLTRHVETDPDCDVEASSSTAGQREQVARELAAQRGVFWTTLTSPAKVQMRRDADALITMIVSGTALSEPEGKRQPAAEAAERGLPMDLAPRDGTIVRLLVDYKGDDAHHPLEDVEEAWTIGANGFDHDGEDVWRFAGWSWQQDVWCEGYGTPIAWAPFENDAQSATPTPLNPAGEREQVAEAVERLRRDCSSDGFCQPDGPVWKAHVADVLAVCSALAEARSEVEETTDDLTEARDNLALTDALLKQAMKERDTLAAQLVGAREAVHRLEAIQPGQGYAAAVMHAYGHHPIGQFYADLASVCQALSMSILRGDKGCFGAEEAPSGGSPADCQKSGGAE